MTAGIETLSQLTEESYEHFNTLGDIIESELPKIFLKHGEKITINRAGSMIGFFLTEGPVVNFDDANRSDLDLFASLFQELLKEGVYLPPSQFEGMFLSTSHTKDHIETTLKAFDNALSRIKSK